MANLHPDTLREIMPDVGARADLYAPALAKSMAEFGITGILRQAAFIAQGLHETMGLKRMTESFNYEPHRILEIFNTAERKRFTPAMAQELGRTNTHGANQPAIANIAYASRMGNGDIQSGDGWKFKGRGIFMLTGEENYAACGKTLKLDLVAHPELIETPDGAARSAGWFWLSKGLNAMADTGDIVAVSKRINGGTNGLAERVNLFQRAKKALS